MLFFICTFDPYGKGRHLYTFEYLCKQEPSLTFWDEILYENFYHLPTIRQIQGP